MDNGSVSVGVTSVPIRQSSTVFRQGLQVKAASTNAAPVYIGGSQTVTANSAAGTDGFELMPGQALFLPCSSPNAFYAIAGAASQKLFYVGI